MKKVGKREGGYYLLSQVLQRGRGDYCHYCTVYVIPDTTCQDAITKHSFITKSTRCIV